MNDQTHLFVYGTLRRGFEHSMADLLADQADFVGSGSFQGRLYDLGGYPGVKPSSRAADTVIGDVYRLRRPLPLLSKLDEYEGYRPANPAQSLYLRQSVSITMTDDRALRAWIYIYNCPTQEQQRIEAGDYLVYSRRS